MCDGPSGTAQAAAATLTTHLSTHWSMAESEDESEYIERHHEQRHTGQGEQDRQDGAPRLTTSGVALSNKHVQ